MKKNNRMKVIEGRLISAALGIAAGIALLPESGRIFIGDVKKKSAEFHAYLAPRFKKIKKVGEKEYNSFVENTMETYTKTKHFSEKEKKALIVHAKKSWKHIKKHSS